MVKVAVAIKKRIPTRPKLNLKRNQVRDNEGRSIGYLHLKPTGEFFTEYDDYAYKLSLLGRPIWECELTGTSPLTYWQAVELERILEALIIRRLPAPLRSEFLAIALPDKEAEKVRRANLVACATKAFFNTFFPGERVKVRVPKVKGLKPGEIVGEAAASEILISEPTDTAVPASEPDPIRAPIPQRAYSVKLDDAKEIQVFDAAQIKTDGLLKHLRLMPLRSLFLKWATSLPLGSDARRSMKAGIPTQSGLMVEVPARSASSLSLGNSEVVPQQKRKAVSFQGPLTKVVVGDLLVSPGLLAVLNRLSKPGLEASGLGTSDGAAPPPKQKKTADSRKRLTEPQADDEREAPPRQKALESAIKYPIEDLDLAPSLVAARRPLPQAVGHAEGFDHLINIWVFLSTFGGFLGVDEVPLFGLRSALVDACSGTAEDRFPLEHLITVLLELICTDADTVTNFYIPEGINEVLDAPTGYSLWQIGDWRRASIPVPLDRWGCVLLGCVKELYCPATLPRGKPIIEHLEASPTRSDAHYRLVQSNYAKAGAKLKPKSELVAPGRHPNAPTVDLNAPPRSSARLKLRPGPGASFEDSDGDITEKAADARYEEDPKVREALEPLIQLQFYSLPVDDKLQLLDFLIEQALGTSKFKAYHSETYDEIGGLRRDRTEVLKELRATQDQLAALEGESKRLEDSYKSLHDDAFQPDPTDSASSAEASSRPARPKAQLRKEASALRQAIQANADAILRLEVAEAKLQKKSDQLSAELEASLGLLRFRPIGADRFYNRYYFVDSRDGPALLVETASPALLPQLTGRDPAELERLRGATEAPPQTNQCAWGVYTSAGEVVELAGWLCSKGVRERALKAALENVKGRFLAQSG
ncbi:hypothetical protein L0F63_000122 [Massospora cicadina]|nr:hypothetical protein L0F63_000122 [Massospora cicadina]